LNELYVKHERRSADLRESVKHLVDFHVESIEKQILFWKSFQQYLNQTKPSVTTIKEGDEHDEQNENEDDNMHKHE